MLNKRDQLTEVEEHCYENDNAKPDVELDRKVCYGDQDVNQGGHNRKNDVVEEPVDRGRAPVHDS